MFCNDQQHRGPSTSRITLQLLQWFLHNDMCGSHSNERFCSRPMCLPQNQSLLPTHLSIPCLPRKMHVISTSVNARPVSRVSVRFTARLLFCPLLSVSSKLLSSEINYNPVSRCHNLRDASWSLMQPSWAPVPLAVRMAAAFSC